MLFRSRRGRGDAAEALLDEIESLTESTRLDRDPDAARRLLQLRHQAGLRLMELASGERPEQPAPAFDELAGGSDLPEVAAGDASPELLRAAILRNGCLLLRGLLDPDEAATLAEGIDRAYEAREARASDTPTDGSYFDEFEPEPQFELAFERAILGTGGSGGLWLVDSPMMTLDVLDAFERAGLRRLATGYLGERPVLSVNKSLLRKVSPDLFGDSEEKSGSKPSAWHQDGAFLGDVRALNVWLSLSRCGDLAPGLDIVPRRVDHIVPTGTEGAVFEWSASQAVAEETAGDVGILRPIFEPGDVLLFDEMFLHSTAAEPDMPSMRYAVESWFFGPSGFPARYAPLAF